MQKSLITVTIQAAPANETDLTAQIVTFLTAQKTQGKIDKASIQTNSIDVPTTVTV